MITNEHPHTRVNKTITNQPTILASWSQAVTTLYRRYGVLVKTISEQEKQVLGPVSQRWLGELKEVLVETVQELSQLITDMDRPCSLDQVPTQAYIDGLRSHITRLQNQSRQIHRVLKSTKNPRTQVHTTVSGLTLNPECR